LCAGFGADLPLQDLRAAQVLRQQQQQHPAAHPASPKEVLLLETGLRGSLQELLYLVGNGSTDFTTLWQLGCSVAVVHAVMARLGRVQQVRLCSALAMLHNATILVCSSLVARLLKALAHCAIH
jgi:hypothetical protein